MPEASEATTTKCMVCLPAMEVEGIMFPKMFERSRRAMKQHIVCIRALEMRDDDVILCAYARSGTYILLVLGTQ